MNNNKENKPKCYPLTSSERGMYLEQKLYPDSVSYNLNVGIIINGAPVETVKNTLNISAYFTERSRKALIT